MKKTIGKTEYDTETATLVRRHSVGTFGDPKGYEESLYQTSGGLYFLYFNGGVESPYATPKICRLSKMKADEWLAENKAP